MRQKWWDAQKQQNPAPFEVGETVYTSDGSEYVVEGYLEDGRVRAQVPGYASWANLSPSSFTRTPPKQEESGYWFNGRWVEENPAWWDKTKAHGRKAAAHSRDAWGRLKRAKRELSTPTAPRRKPTSTLRKGDTVTLKQRPEWGKANVFIVDGGTVGVTWEDGGDNDWYDYIALEKASRNPAPTMNPSGPGGASRQLRALPVGQTLTLNGKSVRRVDDQHWIVNGTRYKLANATVAVQ